MKKIMLAATALAVLAFAALPTVASATPRVSNFTNNNRHFTVEGPEAKLTAGTKVVCESVTGTGEFDETGETGSIKFTFHGCREKTLNSTCQSANEPSGTITTTTLPFHLKTTTGNSTPAVLITSNSEVTTEHFATFKCAGGFVNVVVKGKGIVGEITSGYQKSNKFTVSFKTNEAGEQTPKTVDETPGVEYDLKASINGGAFETAAEDAEGTGTFTEGEPTLEKT